MKYEKLELEKEIRILRKIGELEDDYEVTITKHWMIGSCSTEYFFEVCYGKRLLMKSTDLTEIEDALHEYFD